MRAIPIEAPPTNYGRRSLKHEAFSDSRPRSLSTSKQTKSIGLLLLSFSITMSRTAIPVSRDLSMASLPATAHAYIHTDVQASRRAASPAPGVRRFCSTTRRGDWLICWCCALRGSQFVGGGRYQANELHPVRVASGCLPLLLGRLGGIVLIACAHVHDWTAQQHGSHHLRSSRILLRSTCGKRSLVTKLLAFQQFGCSHERRHVRMIECGSSIYVIQCAGCFL